MSLRYGDIIIAGTPDTSKMQEMIDKMNGSLLMFNDVSVSTDLWVEDTTYSDYPYKAEIPCEGINADYIVDVTFDIAEATSGIYAPICMTGNGVVTIFAAEKPSNKIVIPTIKCVKAVV